MNSVPTSPKKGRRYLGHLRFNKEKSCFAFHFVKRFNIMQVNIKVDSKTNAQLDGYSYKKT